MKKLWIIRHPFKTLFSLCAILLLAVIVFLFWVSHELFNNRTCEVWHRGMTKDKKILAFVRMTNELQLMGPTQIPYPDAETILRNYPECCKLYPSNMYYDLENLSANDALPSFTGKLSDWDERVITVKYPAYFWENDKIRLVTLMNVNQINFQEINSCSWSKYVNHITDEPNHIFISLWNCCVSSE